MYSILYVLKNIGKQINFLWDENDPQRMKTAKRLYYIISLCIIVFFLSQGSSQSYDDDYERQSIFSEMVGLISIFWGILTFIFWVLFDSGILSKKTK